MFGYIRPLKGELKVKDFERFQAAYCGLCDELKQNFGFAARFTVNYDFTFLAMLLSESESGCWEYRRCAANPLLRKCRHVRDQAFRVCASYCVILTYWKLADSVSDEGFIASIAARFAKLLLRKAYNRAVHMEPEFDALVRENIKELTALEEARCDSIDMTADKFALILKAAANGVQDEYRRRVLSELLYHTGRIIYLLDAADDLKRDTESGAYNPLAYRFSADSGTLSEDDRKTLETSLENSRGMTVSAFELLDAGVFHEILSNIVYMGIPWVASRVLTGDWRKLNSHSDIRRPI